MHRVLASVTLALAAATVPLSSASAQLTPQAFYPLLTDLLDATAQYGPVSLLGNTPPAPPANGVCVNGIYYFSASGGQDVRTPNISTLNSNDFQIDVDFTLAALPTATYAPVLMAGNGWRWIGIYMQSGGTIGLKYNNSQFSWSTTTLVPSTVWHTGTIKFENGNVELFLDGLLIHTAVLGVLNTGNNLNFTTNDFSNGRNHNGCIRNLRISNDTTLGSTATVWAYGTGCDGLEHGANGLPTIGNFLFELNLTNVPAMSPLAFVGFGTTVVNPGVDLTGLGMTGCFAHTSLDLGLFGPFPAAGTAVLPLPIPVNPSLAGALLSTQGLSLSAANPLGLASSNGLQLVLGL